MDKTNKLVWWNKGLYITGLIVCLLLGGAEQEGYLFSKPLSIIGYFFFYIPLFSIIGFFWSRLKKKE